MIGVIGISHKTANISIRETYYLSKADIVPFSEIIMQNTDISEVVVLSTCNRTEIYFYQEEPFRKKHFHQIISLLNSYKGVVSGSSDLFYMHTDRDAVQHLFRVTSGMDSMLLGENQIVSQVKECYLKCTTEALTNAILMRLFQKSFEASKQVRSETKIQQGATSLSYVAVDMCIKKHQDIRDKNILLIGTGETGKIALHYLKKQGAEKFFLTNRTYEKARELEGEYGGKAVHFEEFKNLLPEIDIVIAATEAQHPVVSADDIRTYSKNGHGNQQLFLDLSVPRNIDESIHSITNKEIIAVDDLQGIIDGTNRQRNDSIYDADKIIARMTGEFYEWYDNRRLRPLIKSVTANIQEIQRQELVNSRKCYTAEEYKLIEEYSNRLAQKYSRNIIKNIKKLSKKEKSNRLFEKIQSLFTFEGK